MQPKEKISGGFQLKESRIKSSLVSVAVFSQSHIHVCTCLPIYMLDPKGLSPPPPKFSVMACADAWVCLCESKFAAWITVLFGNKSLLLLAHLKTHFFNLYLCPSDLALHGLLKLICLAGMVPWSWAALSVQSEHSPAELVPSSGFASVLSLLLAQKVSFSPGTRCRRTGHKIQR